MASSITLKSDVLKGSRYFQLKCTQKSNGSAENSSAITWELSAVGDSVWYDTGPTKVVINGTTVYSKDRVGWESGKFPVAQGSVSGTITVPHNNDGSKSITVKFSTAVYTTTVHEYSETWKLDSIPRYATITHNVQSKTEETITMNWSSDSVIDWAWYSTDGGETWVGFEVADKKSGTYTIQGLDANTKYYIVTSLRRKDSQLDWDSNSLEVTTYDFPHCTESPNFVLGDLVSLKFYNPIGRTFKFYIIGNGTQINTEYSCSSTTYNGLSSATTTVPYLYATIPNDKSGKYKVKVVYGDSVRTRDNGNTYSIKESECYPTFSAFAYKDSNATVTAVTGNSQALVKGLSNLTVEITEGNKMVANKGANPNYYGVSVDTLSTTKAYSDTGTVTIPVGVISSAGTKRLNVRAYDSRSLSKLQYKDVTVYDYNKPKINASAARLNNFEAQTTLKISGEYSRLTIGGADKNTITKVEYRYREKGGTWGSYVEPSTTLSAGKFSCSEITLTLENTKAFEIEVKVTDKFGTLTASTIPLSVDVGQAILFVSTNKKTCFVNGVEVATKDFVGDAITALFPAGSSVTNALYPVGAVVCMSTNKNPSSMYGGTWTLIDKGFASSNTTNENYFTASANVVEEAVWVTRAGQTMRIRLSVTINVEITDTGLTLGTLNLSNIGISKIPINIVGNVTYSDGANGGIAWSLNETTGELKVTDVFDLTPLPSGNGFNIDVTFPVVYSQMLDSVCDKFYWKRTA